MAKFVVELDDSVAPTDVEDGMRVGVDRSKFKIKVPLPPKIDPSVSGRQGCSGTRAVLLNSQPLWSAVPPR